MHGPRQLEEIHAAAAAAAAAAAGQVAAKGDVVSQTSAALGAVQVSRALKSRPTTIQVNSSVEFRTVCELPVRTMGRY